MKEWFSPVNDYIGDDYMLSLDHLDWTRPLQKGSPIDLGFESSYMTIAGIQVKLSLLSLLIFNKNGIKSFLT